MIGHSRKRQQEPGGLSVTSRALLSEVRIEEAWSVGRITHPGKRAGALGA